jgi:ketopantoate reductase
MNERGLTIRGWVEQFTVHVPAVRPDERRGLLGVVLLAVKAQHTTEAMQTIAPPEVPRKATRMAVSLMKLNTQAHY